MKLLPPKGKAEVSTAPDRAVGVSSVDLIADSIEHPLAVAFSKSSSPNYLAAVEAARHAFKYDELPQGKSVLHMAVFSADRVQLSRALHLLGYIKGLRSTRLFAGGKLLTSSLRIEEVINCYLTSLACKDWRAHCHKVISDDPLEMPGLRWSQPKKPTRYLIPCTLVASYGGRQAVMESLFGSTVQDKLQAIGVRRGCSWCPNFKPNDFKKL